MLGYEPLAPTGGGRLSQSRGGGMSRLTRWLLLAAVAASALAFADAASAEKYVVLYKQQAT